MDVSFEEAMKDYFIFLNHKLKLSTYDTNVRKIRIYILDYFKNKNIFDLTVKDYLNWKLYIDSFNFKYNYKSSLHYCFCDFLDYCMIFYNLNYNVARKIGNFKNTSVMTVGDIWTIDDFNNFINVIDNIVYKCLFKVLFFTGLRKGEILALKWGDINFDNGTILINKTITRYLDKNHNNIITNPKTNSSVRLISITGKLLAELKELKNYYSNDDTKFNDTYFVFGGFKNISFTTLTRKKDYYCNLANVKQIKIHEFRHSHACLLFKNDVPIEDISYRLGHSTISMTMDTYLKYLPKNEKRVLETLNSLEN